MAAPPFHLRRDVRLCRIANKWRCREPQTREESTTEPASDLYATPVLCHDTLLGEIDMNPVRSKLDVGIWGDWGWRAARSAAGAAFAAMLVSCGSGGGGSGTEPLPPPTQTEAARFLTQATFGPTETATSALASQGYGAWLAAEFAKPQTLHRTYMDTMAASLAASGGTISPSNFYESWWTQAIPRL